MPKCTFRLSSVTTWTMASSSPIYIVLIFIIGLLLLVSCSHPDEDRELIIDEEEAQAWLDYLNSELAIRDSRSVELNWNYQTNITDYNQQKYVSVIWSILQIYIFRPILHVCISIWIIILYTRLSFWGLSVKFYLLKQLIGRSVSNISIKHVKT